MGRARPCALCGRLGRACRRGRRPRAFRHSFGGFCETLCIRFRILRLRARRLRFALFLALDARIVSLAFDARIVSLALDARIVSPALDARGPSLGSVSRRMSRWHYDVTRSDAREASDRGYRRAFELPSFQRFTDRRVHERGMQRAHDRFEIRGLPARRPYEE